MSVSQTPARGVLNYYIVRGNSIFLMRSVYGGEGSKEKGRNPHFVGRGGKGVIIPGGGRSCQALTRGAEVSAEKISAA